MKTIINIKNEYLLYEQYEIYRSWKHNVIRQNEFILYEDRFYATDHQEYLKIKNIILSLNNETI